MKNIIDRIDHIVLTVTDIETTTQWYEKALGFEREFFTGPSMYNNKIPHKIHRKFQILFYSPYRKVLRIALGPTHLSKW